MLLIILLAALGLAGLVGTIIELRRDGYRAAPTDWSRATEHDPERPQVGVTYR